MRRILRPLSVIPTILITPFALQIPLAIVVQLLQPSKTSKFRGYQKIGLMASSGYGLVAIGKREATGGQ